MNNTKWVVFGLCFLSLMGGVAVWWVETKISQVTGVVNGAVSDVRETVHAPINFAKETFTTWDKQLAKSQEVRTVVEPLARGASAAIDVTRDAFEWAFGK